MDKIKIKLLEYGLSHPLERMRAGPALLQLDVLWEATEVVSADVSRTRMIRCPGICELPDGQLTAQVLGEYMDKAIAFSRQQLEKLLGTGTVVEGQNGPEVLRTLLTRRKEDVRPHLEKTMGDKGLDQQSGDTHQRLVDDLCDVLGISRISIQGTTVLEASAVISELQYVTKNITRVGE